MLPRRTALEIVNIHASCVAPGHGGVLILGQSGQGKSDLALRLMDRGAVLVSDDQTLLSVAGGRLVAAPPAAIAGRLEARGLGIVDLPHRVGVPVALLADLRPAVEIERLPEAAEEVLSGVAIRRIDRSEEHTSELQSLMRISYAGFCLKKK